MEQMPKILITQIFANVICLEFHLNPNKNLTFMFLRLPNSSSSICWLVFLGGTWCVSCTVNRCGSMLRGTLDIFQLSSGVWYSSIWDRLVDGLPNKCGKPNTFVTHTNDMQNTTDSISCWIFIIFVRYSIYFVDLSFCSSVNICFGVIVVVGDEFWGNRRIDFFTLNLFRP